MPAASQLGDAAPAHLRKRIVHRNDDALHAGANQRLRARRRLTLMATRLQRNVHRGARRALAGHRKRVHFRMRAAELFVPAFADDLAVLNDHAADHRVRLDRALAARGEREARET